MTFEFLMKLNHVIKLEKDPSYFYWDTRRKDFFSVADIRDLFSKQIQDQNLQMDIIRFFAVDDARKAKFVTILENQADVPANSIAELTNKADSVVIPFTDVVSRSTILNSVPTNFEYYGEVFLLTKQECWSLIYTNFNELLPHNVNITYMRYDNTWRYATTRKYFLDKREQETDLLQIEFEINSRLACICFSKNNLTILKFLNISEHVQNGLIKIFERFQIVAETKRNIRVKFLPRPQITNKSLIIPLRDELMTGKLARFIITIEYDKPLEFRKRGSYLLGGVKITIPRSDINDEIFFKVAEKLTYLDYLYFYHFFQQFVKGFYENKKTTIELYKKNVKSVTILETVKEKKTKKLIDELRQTEPTIFGDIYTQDCQYQRQPYIIEENLEEFEKKLEELFGNKKELEEFLKRKSESGRRATSKDLMLVFPTDEFADYYPFASKRNYACIGRKGIDYNQYPFPLVQKKPSEVPSVSLKSSDSIVDFLNGRKDIKAEVKGAPCCFQKLHEDEKLHTGGKSHMLTKLKNVPTERKGIVQSYLSSFVGKEYYRYGIKDFKTLIERLGQIGTTSDDFTFTIGNINYWSFQLEVNLILYETIYKYNTLIVKIIPSFINQEQDKFVFYTKNTLGNYEQVKTKFKTFHTKEDSIGKYILTFFNILENEKLTKDGL